MFLHRAQRRRLVTLLVGVLLLAQWLVAAHACVPGPGAGPVPGRAPAQAVSPHCHGAEMGAVGAMVDVASAVDRADTAGAVDAGDAADVWHLTQAPAHASGVCQAHCSADGQAPTTAASADLPAPALGWCLVVAPLDLSPATTMAVAARATPVRAGAPPGWPPLYLLHGALRN